MLTHKPDPCDCPICNTSRTWSITTSAIDLFALWFVLIAGVLFLGACLLTGLGITP